MSVKRIANRTVRRKIINRPAVVVKNGNADKSGIYKNGDINKSMLTKKTKVVR